VVEHDARGGLSECYEPPGTLFYCPHCLRELQKIVDRDSLDVESIEQLGTEGAD
jgi:Zn finger protein HypA/HybF involved in hydrogenase expression